MSEKTTNSEGSEIQNVKSKFDPKALLEIFDFVDQEKDHEKELIRALRAGESSDRVAHFNPKNHLLDLHKKQT